MTYVASDLHLDHRNVIEYCDRPFESVTEMNDALVERWNAVVDPDETVLFLGDLVPFEDREHVVQGWLNELDGQFVFVRGNHDEAVSIESHEQLTLEVAEFELYLTHYPEDVPADWDGWAVYGHHHNNDPDRYPFVDPAARRVNVSIELLGFEPVPFPELFGYLRRGERLTVRPGVDPSRALQTE
ncbi:MAG: metallophosphoesterase [Haloarculaceae archaeon]